MVSMTPLHRNQRGVQGTGAWRLTGLGAYLGRRLVAGTLTLLVSTFLVFSSLYLSGDPLTALSRGRTLTPTLEVALRSQYRLDDPFFVRYLRWLGDLLHGDFGSSLMYKNSVASLIGDRIGVTFELAAVAGLLIILIGIGSGVLAGLKPGPVDSSMLMITTVLMAIPPFVSAIILLALFAVGLGWFPTRGGGDGLLDQLWHLTLPAVALALAGLAIVSRVTRTAVRAELYREHVQTAISRGIPRSVAMRRHVLRNALIPVTTVTGISIASLVALTAIVEQAFGINGLGNALVQAASYNDFPVVQGIAMIYVVVFVVANTLVDLSYGFMDPRVRLGAGA
jgi:peptide/nickel transport system permease protein